MLRQSGAREDLPRANRRPQPSLSPICRSLFGEKTNFTRVHWSNHYSSPSPALCHLKGKTFAGHFHDNGHGEAFGVTSLCLGTGLGLAPFPLRWSLRLFPPPAWPHPHAVLQHGSSLSRGWVFFGQRHTGAVRQPDTGRLQKGKQASKSQ